MSYLSNRRHADSVQGLDGSHPHNDHENSHHAFQGADDDDMASLWSQYMEVKRADEMKTALLDDIIEKYAGTKRMLDNLQVTQGKGVELLSLLHAQEEKNKMLEGNIQHLQRIMNRDAFIMAIIDGNGTIFHPDFLAQGEAGGKQAAKKLHEGIANWATANVVDYPSSARIACRVYADLVSLSDSCQRAGLVDSAQKVVAFFRGFTRGKALFDFVDVGQGKDRVEVKVAEAFKLHLFDFHCRQILLGCSHDDRYARTLEIFEDEPSISGRVTLMEGIPFEPELKGLSYRKASLHHLFYGKKLSLELFDDANDTLSDLTSPSATPGVTPASLNRPAAANTAIATGLQRFPSPAAVTWATTAAKLARAPLADSRPTSAIDTVSRLAAIEVGIKRNRKGQRLDTDLPYDRDEVLQMKKLKCCNQHYIGVGCCHYNAGKADKCPHNHEYILSADELQVLRVVSRETPCKRGHGCEDRNCIYGHKCPFPAASEGGLRGTGLCLNGPNCRFPHSMHNMDLEPVRTIKVT